MSSKSSTISVRVSSPSASLAFALIRTIWFSIGGRNASLLVFDDDIVWDEENEEDQTKEVQTP